MTDTSFSEAGDYVIQQPRIYNSVWTNPGNGISIRVAQIIVDSGNESFATLRKRDIARLRLMPRQQTTSIQDAGGGTRDFPLYGPVVVRLPATAEFPDGKSLRIDRISSVDNGLEGILGVDDIARARIVIHTHVNSNFVDGVRRRMETSTSEPTE